jgi:hypothetical protein
MNNNPREIKYQPKRSQTTMSKVPNNNRKFKILALNNNLNNNPRKVE